MGLTVIAAGTIKKGVGQIIEDDFLIQIEQTAFLCAQMIFNLFLVTKRQFGGLIPPIQGKIREIGA